MFKVLVLAFWQCTNFMRLGSPVLPFCSFSFGDPLLKPNSKNKGTLIIEGLLGNLGELLSRNATLTLASPPPSLAATTTAATTSR